MSNLKNLMKIYSLITLLTGESNTYKLTNISSKLVRISFEYIKKKDRTQILTIPAFENCLEILTSYANAGKNFTIEELIRAYKDDILHLEKINIKKEMKELDETIDKNIDFIN